MLLVKACGSLEMMETEPEQTRKEMEHEVLGLAIPSCLGKVFPCKHQMAKEQRYSAKTQTMFCTCSHLLNCSALEYNVRWFDQTLKQNYTNPANGILDFC